MKIDNTVYELLLLKIKQVQVKVDVIVDFCKRNLLLLFLFELFFCRLHSSVIIGIIFC